jgi:hypothetical protein
MGRHTYHQYCDLGESEGHTLALRDAAYRKAMHYANLVFLDRLEAEHNRSGRQAPVRPDRLL